MKKIATSLILSAATIVFLPSYGSEARPIAKPLILSGLDGLHWVEKCTEEHPEILWLADVNVRKTQEGSDTLQGTYSEQLFGIKYVEFDRTIMTLHCLKLFLEGGDKAYAVFTAAQPEAEKLSRSSFDALHRQGRRLMLQSKVCGISKEEMAQLMETALILGDMGKSQKARDIFAPYGIHAPDHDDFYGEVMGIVESHPELCPSFAKLPSSAKKLLVKMANLAHYGHITHLEGGVNMFAKLKETNVAFNDPIALHLDLFIHICDVAGALGHVNNRSSVVYTESTHRAKQAMAEAVLSLRDQAKTEKDAFNAYLHVRAAWLGLNSQDSSERVLARIGAMLRLFTFEEGVVLRKAIAELDSATRARIALQLDAGAHKSASGRTPTYMPAVLVNLSNNAQLGKTKEERLAKAITLGLPFIARVLEKHQEMVAKQAIDPAIPLNFNAAAGVAKQTPELLSNDFTIDKEGIIRLAENDSAQGSMPLVPSLG